MSCENELICCNPDVYEYSSYVPDPAPEPPADASCPTCTEDVPGNCVIEPPDAGDLNAWVQAYTDVFHDEIGVDPATNGETVGLWQDQSAAGINLNQSVFQPGMTFHTNVQNGLPVIRSYAKEDSGTIETAGSLIGFNLATFQQQSIVVAMRFRTDPLWPALNKRAAFVFGGVTNIAQVVRNGDGSLFVGRIDGQTGVVVDGFSGGNIPLDEFVIISVVFNGAGSFFRINNGPKFEGTTALQDQTVITIGGQSTPAEISESLRTISCCDYCEIARYEGVLTDAQIFGLTNYLSQTWNIPIA